MKNLNVYLHQEVVGKLTLDEGQMVFIYSDDWLNNPNAVPLSQSLPLRKEVFSRKECRGFFAGVLPEEHKREVVAQNLGISKTNDFAMLEQIGGECAGAVSFIPEGEILPINDYRYRTLSESELQEILELLPRRPLMAGEDGIRLSLAGAQDKIAVHVADGKISIPMHAAPSTHIIKPAIDRFERLVFNEAFCLELANLVGIPTAKAEIRRAGAIDYLLVERYDRRIDANGTVHRLHQEDFCQALGIVSENKYQNEGGPSLKDCFELLRRASTRPVIDLAHLLDAVIFNLLIGNHDAHGKNFSLLYVTPANSKVLKWEDSGFWFGKSCELAPLYDLVSTVHYPELSKKMAMKLGGESESSKITLKNLEQFAQDAGLAAPMVKKRVFSIGEKLLKSIDEAESHFPQMLDLSENIRIRTKVLIQKL